MPSGTRNISSYMDICGWGVISERVKVAFLFRALQTPPRLNLGVKPQTVISSRVVRCMCKFGLCEWSKRQTTGSRSHSLQPEHFTLLVVGCVQSETAAEAADNQHKRASRRRLKTRGDLGLIETETAPVQNDSEFEPFRAKVSQSWAVKCFFTSIQVSGGRHRNVSRSAAQNEDDPGEFLASRTTEQTSLIRLMSSTCKARGGRSDVAKVITMKWHLLVSSFHPENKNYRPERLCTNRHLFIMLFSDKKIAASAIWISHTATKRLP